MEERKEASEKLEAEIEALSKIDLQKVLLYSYHRKIIPDFQYFFWRTHVLFWATVTPVIDFGWHLLWVSKPEWVLPCSLFCGGDCNVCSLRPTSGATHAYLLVTGSAASHFPTCINRGGTWLRFERAITRTEVFIVYCLDNGSNVFFPSLQIKYEDIIKILKEGVKALNSLKTKWSELVDFFQLTSTLISTNVDGYLEPVMKKGGTALKRRFVFA